MGISLYSIPLISVQRVPLFASGFRRISERCCARWGPEPNIVQMVL